LPSAFSGMSRDKEDLVYFDKRDGDVVSYVQGYFSLLCGDQSISGRILAKRIMNGESHDFVDEDRYLLFPRLSLEAFLQEYQKQANGQDPFIEFVSIFSLEVILHFSNNYSTVTVEDLAFDNYIQDLFQKSFTQKYGDRVMELGSSYSRIYEAACKELARNWIKKEVCNN